MLFNSYKFIFIFFPLVFVIAKKIKREYLLPFIVIISFYFYSFAGHKWFLIPMLVTTVLDFFLAPLIAKSQTQAKKKLFLIISLTANLGMLFYFKYSYLIFTSFAAPSSPWATLFKVVLPAGISFYTFQTISYIVDVYRGTAHVETNFWRFAGFVSFFPHLVAGPLTRHNQLIPALDKVSREGIQPRYEEGIYLFVIGLAKKIIIADQITMIIDPMIDRIELFNFLDGWLTVLGYTLQIYFDFSGYSDMAIGLSRLFGIELPQNFNSPYQAKNISDFWRRWHISLSLWLRDYLYISLGGNRKRKNLNLFITMVLGGLWHGANWTFAFWGAYHGTLLMIHHSIEKYWEKIPLFLQRLVTLLLVAIGWIFFRSKNFSEAALWCKSLINFSVSGIYHEYAYQKLIILIIVGFFIANIYSPASRYAQFKNLSARYQILLAILFTLSLMLMKGTSKFLYFQF